MKEKFSLAIQKMKRKDFLDDFIREKTLESSELSSEALINGDNSPFANASLIIFANVLGAKPKEVINESNKKVYVKDKYRVTIMSEFDYLIVVIAEL